MRGKAVYGAGCRAKSRKWLNKKGVIEMMETFVILFVIFIIIGFGMFIFYKFSISSTKETAEDACMLASKQLLSAIPSMPEIQCSEKADAKQDCIDTAKLLFFGGTEKAKSLSSTACKKTIEIRQVFPVPEPKYNSTECTLEKMRDDDFPAKCGKWTLVDTDDKTKESRIARGLSVPIALYYPQSDTKGLGKLVITTYTVQS